MYDVGSLSEIQRLQRVEGSVRISARRRGEASVLGELYLGELYQQGSAKAKRQARATPTVGPVVTVDKARPVLFAGTAFSTAK